MYVDTLPYSNKRFRIPAITFRDIFNIARLYYDDNDAGVVELLEDVLDIKTLNCIDKFFVMCRACQVYVTESLTLTDKEDKQVNLSLGNIISRLENMADYGKVYHVGDIKLTLDVPNSLFTDKNKDIFTSVIKQISIDDVDIDVRQLNEDDAAKVLASLPAAAYNVIREHVSNLDLRVVLVDEISQRGISEISVNFMSFEPGYVIKALYSGYHLLTCRDIIYHLSSKLGGETLLNSTPSDINYYLEEFEKENKKQSGGVSNPVL